MYNATDRCKLALTGSHTRTPVVEVYQGFQTMVASTYTTPRIEVDASVGGIKVEYGAKHTRSLTSTILDAEGLLVPTRDMGTLDPVARPQVQTYSKIGWEDDLGYGEEIIPTGRFYIDKNTVVESGSEGVTMEIRGNSRSSTAIQDNRWTQPYQMLSNVTWDLAMQTALQDRNLPGWLQQFRFETSQNVMPLGVQLIPDDSSDPWAQLQAMAASDAKELLEDAFGAFVFRTPPNVKRLDRSAAVWQYVETPASPSHEVGSKRDIDITRAYNGAIVNGNAPWLLSPIQGVAWDNDPGSPTYFRGPFGMRPKTFSDETVGSEDQADAVAFQKLSTILGISEQIDFDTLPNPCHEPGDVVIVQMAATKVDDLVILQSFELPYSVEDRMPVMINRVRT